MITKGWAWKVIYSCIDEAFPKFAVVAQSALNVRDHVAATMGELEVAMCLARTACEMTRIEALHSIACMCLDPWTLGPLDPLDPLDPWTLGQTMPN